MEEIWKTIPTLIGYEASSLGRIRSVEGYVEYTSNNRNQFMAKGILLNKRMLRQGKILSLGCTKTQKYKNFSGLSDKGIFKSFMVHRCVCLAFHGLPPENKNYAAHLDGNTFNNLPENLQWCSQKENLSHKKSHGTTGDGSKNGMSKITEKDIPYIFELYASGKSHREISKFFGLNGAAISKIINRQRWKCVPIEQSVIDACKKISLKNISLGNEFRLKKHD